MSELIIIEGLKERMNPCSIVTIIVCIRQFMLSSVFLNAVPSSRGPEIKCSESIYYSAFCWLDVMPPVQRPQSIHLDHSHLMSMASAAAAAVIDDDVEQSESSGYVSMETMPKGETLRLNLLLLLDHIEDSSRHYFIPRKIIKVQAM